MAAINRGLDRRGFGKLVGAGALGALGTNTLASRVAFADDDDESTRCTPGGGANGGQGRIVGVDISQHPVPFPANLNTVVDFDQAYLDSMARRYWDEYAQFLNRPLNEFDRADFWFRYIAIPLQEKAMLGNSLATVGANRIERDLALIHMVGYYGGIWFFKKLEQFTGADQTARCNDPVAERPDSAFQPMTDILKNIIDVARGNDEGAVLDLAEFLLRSGDLTNTADPDDLPTRRGLIGGYSYNVGYTNAILVPDNRALPPPANPAGPPIDNPPWNSFEFTPNGVFDATYPVWADPATQQTKAAIPNPTFDHTKVPYLIGDTAGMKLAREHFARAQGTAGYNRVEAGLLDRHGNVVTRGPLGPLAQAGFNTGTATWTAPGLLDIRNWDEPSYHLIVALSVFFVQALQAAGQADMAAAALGDADLGRNGLMTTAVALPFGLSYLLGAGQRFNEHYACRVADESVPPFVFETADTCSPGGGNDDDDRDDDDDDHDDD